MQRALFLFSKITNLKVFPIPTSYKTTVIPLEILVIEYFKFLLSQIVFVKKYEI